MSNVWYPRLSAPANTDPNFINRNYGGYNGCIPIQGNGCVMPNCTGYAWGRWLETAGSCTLSTSNAANWFGNTGDGYARGSVPALGACICFSTAGGQPGHVAIVEQIIDDDTIVTSDSNYGAEYFVLRTRRRAWGWNWWNGGVLYFQGFIYNPAGGNADDPGEGGEPIEPVKPVKRLLMFAAMLRKKRKEQGNGIRSKIWHSGLL